MDLLALSTSTFIFTTPTMTVRGKDGGKDGGREGWGGNKRVDSSWERGGLQGLKKSSQALVRLDSR